MKVALCAPTGLAAQRMKSIIGVKASTIHRMLRIRSGGIRRDGLMLIPLNVDH